MKNSKNTKNSKNSKNIKLTALLTASALLLTSFAFTLMPSCVLQSVQTSETSDQPEYASEYKTLLEDMVEQYADVVKSFEQNEAAVNLEKSISPAKIVLAKLTAGETDNNINAEMEAALHELTEATEQFKAYYLDTSNKTEDANLINALYVGGIKCGYNASSRTFYYTMGKTPDREFISRFEFESESKSESKSESETQNVFFELYDNNGSPAGYKFIPQLNAEYTLKARTEKSAYDYKMIFTMLPIIQINNIEYIDENYKNCTISVIDPDFTYNAGTPMEQQTAMFIESNAKIHIRGGISRWYPKQPYTVKFVTENGQNRDLPLFGMRKDSDWILDAMYIDKARMRNRVSTDVWHSMDSPLYYMTEDMKPQTNGTNGVFVEVFLNNEYIGLYCFTEKIDRKQLQLQRNDDGLNSMIYKGYTWEDPVLMRGYYDYNNEWWTWGGFKQMYPRALSGGQIEWQPLADFVDFAVNSSDNDFAANVSKYIDINNFVDYTILMIITFAYDNTGKNAFWSIYDITDINDINDVNNINGGGLSKIFITPWDLDASWGGSWEGSHIRPDIAWMDSEYEHDSHLFRRLILTNADGFADKVKSRWEELRDNALSVDTITKRFDDYFDLFDKSGAWERESRKWRESRLDLDGERAYIKGWVKERWNYTDDFITNKLQTVGDFAAEPPRRRGRQ